MDIIVKRLSPELIEDYFDFFNNRAFTDNPPWGGCYCLGWQITREQEKEQLYDRLERLGGGDDNFMRVLGEMAVSQISTGLLRGYLAYVDGMAVGWCNVNDRAALPEESANGAKLHAPAEARERAVLCFEIAPKYRGRGVATALLSRAIDDAEREGCRAIVSFPRVLDERDEWDYTGPFKLYEKAGFSVAHRQNGNVVMRRELNP